MLITQISGKIKTILRPVTNPNPSYIFRINHRLLSAHEYLVSIRESGRYKPEFIKVKLSHKIHASIPLWFDCLTTVLEQYLNVVIFRDQGVLKAGKTVETLSIVGDKPDVLLAQHYIDYIFTVVDKLHEAKREEVKVANRKKRRKARRGGVDNYSKDARVVSSDFRDRVLKTFLSILNELLDDLKNNHPYAYELGEKRRDILVDYLKNKYSKSWRTVLSTKCS